MQTRSSLQRQANPESNPLAMTIKPRPWSVSPQPPQTVQRQSGQDGLIDLFSHDPGPRPTPSLLQAKLTVGAPNDVYEQEADRVAEQVMSMPDTKPAVQREGMPEEEEDLQTKPLGGLIQREAMPEEEEEIQTKPLAATITPLVQREALPEEEEEVQTKALGNSIQREALTEEEPVQPKLIQREAAPEEEEEPLQAKLIQREAMPEEEEVQAKPLGGSIQREAMPEEEEEPLQAKLVQREAIPEEEEEVQTKRSPDAAFSAGSNLESRLSSSQGGGSPLPDEVRSFMEPRFGADFNQVRVHTSNDAVQMNRDLNAQAFTHKQDVYFGAGKAPAKDELTAHELTHVVQQAGKTPYSTIQCEGVNNSTTALEKLKTIQGLPMYKLLAELSGLSSDILSDEGAGEYVGGPRLKIAMQAVKAKGTSWLDFSNSHATQLSALFQDQTAELLAFLGAPKDTTDGIRTGGFTANSLIQGYDSTVRINQYTKQAQELSQKIFEDYKSGKISHTDARLKAITDRNAALAATRDKLSPGGRAFSRAIKEEGKSVEELVAKYSLEVIKKDLPKYGLKTLDPTSSLYNKAAVDVAMKEVGQTAKVSEEIIVAAGRTGKLVTGIARVGKVAGPIGVAVGLGISGYEIINAPEGQRLYVAGREASGLGGGTIGAIGGGLVAGWVASLACGPAAPICAVVVSMTIVGASSYAGGRLGEGLYKSMLGGSGTIGLYDYVDEATYLGMGLYLLKADSTLRAGVTPFF